MTLATFADLFVRIAPFLAIVITELTGTGYEARLQSVYADHRAETPLESPALEDCEDFALFSFDHENAVQHLDLTLITLVILFTAQVLGTAGDRTALVLSSVAFLTVIMAVYGVRRGVDGYLKERSPHRYLVDDTRFGGRYGTLAVIGSNCFVVLVVLSVELLIG